MCFPAPPGEPVYGLYASTRIVTLLHLCHKGGGKGSGKGKGGAARGLKGSRSRLLCLPSQSARHLERAQTPRAPLNGAAACRLLSWPPCVGRQEWARVCLLVRP